MSRYGVRVLLVLGTVCAFIAVFALWANRQLLNTDAWTSTSSRLLESEPIRDALAGFLVDQLFANVDVAEQLESVLPDELEVLGAPAAGALRGPATKLAGQALATSQVQAVWADANRAAHKQLLAIVRNRSKTASVEGDTLTLDLGTLVGQVATRLGLPADLASRIPPGVGRLVVLRSDEVGLVRSVGQGLSRVAAVIVGLVVVLFALALALAGGRRLATLRNAGIGLIVAGTGALIARSLGGGLVVDSLAKTAEAEPAVTDVWGIGTSLLVLSAGSLIVIGVLIALGAWLAGRSRRGAGWLLAGAGLLAALVGAAPAAAGFQEEQGAVFAKLQERRAEYGAPAYRALQARVGLREEGRLLAAIAADPARNPLGSVCAHRIDFCQGDARLYDWQAEGHGLLRQVLWTDPDGATISGHVWATRAGPERRPVVVISNGSLQAPEQFYWWAATTLAKSGYVVLTFDPQGQGRSDTLGEGQDLLTHVPAELEYLSQKTSSYLDGTRSAIDFALSRPGRDYRPAPSRVTAKSHARKQERRVGAGLNPAFNPLWRMVDRRAKVGVAGHSTGTGVVEQISRDDRRVGAAVLWDAVDYGDNLQLRSYPAPPNPKKPLLALWADYGLPPLPYSSEPDPLARLEIFDAYRRAGVDTMSVAIRGGSHAEFSYIASSVLGGATLRGIDMAAWYSLAWFDKYLKGSRDADSRLLSDRWTRDALEAAVDPRGSGNLVSTYYRSGIAIRRGRQGQRRALCRWRGTSGCALLRPDGEPGRFSYLDLALSPDGRR